jgi:hypothetical protein
MPTGVGRKPLVKRLVRQEAAARGDVGEHCLERVSGRHRRSAGVWGSAPPGTRTPNPLIKIWLGFSAARTCGNGCSCATIIP